VYFPVKPRGNGRIEDYRGILTDRVVSMEATFIPASGVSV
jgi:hypothetical protein